MRGKSGSFGDRLRLLRRRKGKTQLEVAEELKSAYPELAISQANVSHLERRTQPPRSDILETLADYFGVSVQYLLRDTSESYEERKPKVASHIASLKKQTHLADGFFLHTDDNSSGDKETLDTTDNLGKFYRSTDMSGK